MQITLINKESIEGLEKLLIKYSENPDNPETNFYLGICYESLGHTAPALSYFLRCAERTDDKLLAYESLIRGGFCYKKQGGRDWTAKTLFQHALLTLPKRPEAYSLLSRFCREREQMQDAYIYATQGLEFVENIEENLRFDCEYHGEIGLLYDKAVSGWTWGKVDESVKILNDIYNSNDSHEYSQKSKDALKKFGKWEEIGIDIQKLSKTQINDIMKQLLDQEVYELWKSKTYKDKK